MFYTEEFRPRYSELDRHGSLKYEAIVAVLENAAGHHSESADDDMLTNRSKGVSWILAEWRVSIARRPASTDTMRVRTWVRGRANSSLIYRDLIMTDAGGEELVRAEAKFVLMDLSTGRLTRVGEERFLSYGAETETVFSEDAPKLRALEEYDRSVTMELRESDIDINGHVHNTKYMELVYEVLCRAYGARVFDQADGIAAFRLCCRHPLLPGGTVELCAGETDGAFHVLIGSNGTECALCELIKRS